MDGMRFGVARTASFRGARGKSHCQYLLSSSVAHTSPDITRGTKSHRYPQHWSCQNLVGWHPGARDAYIRSMEIVGVEVEVKWILIVALTPYRTSGTICDRVQGAQNEGVAYGWKRVRN
jgi:hypothetical protein